MQDLKMADYKLIEVKDLAGESFQTMIDIDGHRLTTFTKHPEVAAEIVHNIANMELREDDIMFCTAAKSGTHWGFEIISMLVNGKAESIPVHKEQTMLEVIPQSEMKKLQSPRVLNSHLSLSLLPKQLKEKKTKIVLILRNLKDMSVSFFHHHTGVKFYGYSGKFKDYLPVLLNGELDYGDWFVYVKEWEAAMESNDYNIHLLFFEDLKENGAAEIKKIAKFIGVPENDELCEAICDKCHFDKMAAVKQFPEEVAQKYFKNNFSMYRKGFSQYDRLKAIFAFPNYFRRFKLRKREKIRNQYNQVPQDTNGKVKNSQLDIPNESQEVSPFPEGDHKASINRRAQKHSKHMTEIILNDQQKK